MKKLLYLLPVLAVLLISCGDKKPSVTTLDTTNMQMHTATLNAKLVLPGQMTTDFEIGFEISEDQTFPKSNTKRVQSEFYDTKLFKYSYNLEILEPGTTYYVRAYMKNQMGLYIGDIKSFKTEGNKLTYVDLGLSVKWATCNVGATKPEEYGDYFAWGETVPKSDCSWSTYKYCNGDFDELTKYCSISSYGNNGFTDTKTVLDPEDDAAHVNWGGSWRMPTKEEQDELRNTDNCTWTWTTLNGTNGYKVQSKKLGYTDKWIFLPAAGYRNGSDFVDVGSYGYYWSSSLTTVYPSYAYYLRFNSSYVNWNGSNRNDGLSVRPVCP